MCELKSLEGFTYCNHFHLLGFDVLLPQRNLVYQILSSKTYINSFTLKSLQVLASTLTSSTISGIGICSKVVYEDPISAKN